MKYEIDTENGIGRRVRTVGIDGGEPWTESLSFDLEDPGWEGGEFRHVVDYSKFNGYTSDDDLGLLIHDEDADADSREWARETLALRVKAAEARDERIRITKLGKPCRYKACNGAIHGPGEKCPVASSRGAKGGSKKGASKARNGDNNGRAKSRRSCCDTLRSKPHALTCRSAKIGNRKDTPKLTLRRARKEAIKAKPEIEWAGFSVPPSLFAGHCRTITGECGGCGESMSASKAAKIHRADIIPENENARLICGGCA